MHCPADRYADVGAIDDDPDPAKDTDTLRKMLGGAALRSDANPHGVRLGGDPADLSTSGDERPFAR
jgi:hypothetical protein